MSLAALRKQLQDVETAGSAARSTSRTNGKREGTNIATAASLHVPLEAHAIPSYESTQRVISYDTKTFAQALEDLNSDGVSGAMSNDGRHKRNRKREQEEKLAARQASRAQRQLAADEARVAFGLTSTEKKARKNRAVKAEEQQFAKMQATAGKDFIKRARRAFAANFVAIVAQLMFIFEVSACVAGPPGYQR
jgi:hypothetical protein